MPGPLPLHSAHSRSSAVYPLSLVLRRFLDKLHLHLRQGVAIEQASSSFSFSSSFVLELAATAHRQHLQARRSGARPRKEPHSHLQPNNVAGP